MDIILASASPRRTELLTQIGIRHSIAVSDFFEQLNPTVSPELNAAKLALGKAIVVSNSLESGFVIGADTIVVSQGNILGKPCNQSQALNMLEQLSGKVHQVITAVAIIDASGQQQAWQGIEKTQVYFKTLTDEMLQWYLATGESLDKAGAYGIQGFGALLVERIEGCYFNVVGLPLNKVVEGLQKLGVDIYHGRGK